MASEHKTTSAIKIAVIPILLALAALYWLTFVSDLRIFNRTVSQDNRHAEIVGAKPLPREPIKLVAINGKRECSVIDRLEIDNDKLWVYWHNACGKTLGSIKVGVKGKAPDGTIVTSFWHYLSGADVEPNERQESTQEIEADPRIAIIEVRLYQ